MPFLSPSFDLTFHPLSNMVCVIGVLSGCEETALDEVTRKEFDELKEAYRTTCLPCDPEWEEKCGTPGITDSTETICKYVFSICCIEKICEYAQFYSKSSVRETNRIPPFVASKRSTRTSFIRVIWSSPFQALTFSKQPDRKQYFPVFVSNTIRLGILNIKVCSFPRKVS